MTARQETAGQLARCAALRKQIATSRLALRRECALQERSLRRERTRLTSPPVAARRSSRA
jgi:hypothetical protein